METDGQRSSLPLFLQPHAPLDLSGLHIVMDERGWPRAMIPEGLAADDKNRLALYVAAAFEEPFKLPSSKAGTELAILSKSS